jgi:hypothetical protein
MKTTTEQNKQLVLEAFDTLFNQRDYTAAADLPPWVIWRMERVAWTSSAA